MIRRFKIGFDVELHKRTLERALLSLEGPRARTVAGAEALPEAEHANVGAAVDGVPVLLVATQAGVDVIVDAEQADRVSQRCSPSAAPSGSARPTPRSRASSAGARATASSSTTR